VTLEAREADKQFVDETVTAHTAVLWALYRPVLSGKPSIQTVSGGFGYSFLADTGVKRQLCLA
jgi:hypothetical protein